MKFYNLGHKTFETDFSCIDVMILIFSTDHIFARATSIFIFGSSPSILSTIKSITA